MSRSDFDFQSIINPIDTKTFFTQYWEKHPYHIARNDPKYYSNLLSIKDIDSIVRFHGSSLSEVELIKENSFFSSDGVVKVDNNKLTLVRRLIQEGLLTTI